MTDMASITAVLSSIKTATDIAKALSTLGPSLEAAEHKMKIAELMELLAQTKIETIALQESMSEKEGEISRLQDALSLKVEIVKAGDAYFRKNSKGRPFGEPFCLRCWEADKKLFHLVHSPAGSDVFACSICRSEYAYIGIAWHEVQNE
jgi:hypothetical protein